MSDCYINWRFGYRHLQIGKYFIRITVNPHWKQNKPEKWFEVY